MSEAKFTPGPWIVDSKWPAHRSHHCISAAVGQPREHRAMAQVVTTVDGEPYPEGMANARLISAAPEMFEATAPLDHIGIDEELALMPDDTMATITIGAHTFCAITLGDFKNISAALAKARGET